MNAVPMWENTAVFEHEVNAGTSRAALPLDQADPAELALIVAALYSTVPLYLCRAIDKALGVHHD